MITMKEVGENLRKTRQLKNISPYKIEKDIGISHELQYRWENGKTEPSIINMIKLAEYYGISLDELIFFDWIIERIW